MNKTNTIQWISCKDELPELGDYLVLVCAMHGVEDAYKWDMWQHGEYDYVHVMEYFNDMANGFDDDGKRIYSKLYLSCEITHWAYINLPE